MLEGLENGWMEGGGEYVSQPRRDLRPAPFKTFRGRTFAAAVSPDSMPVMAKLGVALLVVPQKPWEDVRKDFEVYRQFFREENAGAEAPPPLCAGFYFVDESADRAEEMARRYIAGYYHTVMKHYEFSAGHLARTPRLRVLLGGEQAHREAHRGGRRGGLHAPDAVGDSAAGPGEGGAGPRNDRARGDDVPFQLYRDAV